MKKALRFIPLGGTEGVNKNMYLYEYGDDILVVDCGLGFPDQTMLGVERVLPDFSYLSDNVSKIRGIIITHGHEDHFGALPYLLSKLNVPVYSTRLVSGFIKNALGEFGIKDVHLHVFDPEKDTFSLGVFKITPFRVNHSVPDSVGYILKTPVGKIFHISDFKFDWTPINDLPFDLSKVAKEASQGVLILLSDCLGVNNEGHTQSERTIKNTFRSLLSQAKGQVLITTISSNISRIQQAVDVSLETGRKIVFVGRSLRDKVSIAQRLGYLKIRREDVVRERKAKDFPQDRLTYLVAGSYGQNDSALSRIAYGTHRSVGLQKRALVIFSADPAPPGTKILVDALVDQLIKEGADVHYYDIQENLHVSGHASRQDLALLINLVRPKFFIPLGGTLRHMRSYKGLVREIGQDSKKVFELPEGQVVEFFNNQARLGKKIKLRDVLITGFGQIDQKVLAERRGLSQRGVVVVSIVFSLGGRTEIEVASLGFVLEKDYYDLSKKAKEAVREALALKRGNLKDFRLIKEEIRKRLENFFLKATGVKPIVLVILHRC